jgi:hypothetical protein
MFCMDAGYRALVDAEVVKICSEKQRVNISHFPSSSPPQIASFSAYLFMHSGSIRRWDNYMELMKTYKLQLYLSSLVNEQSYQKN